MSILLQNWNSICPSQTEKKYKSPLCGESSPNSSSGKSGWSETIEFSRILKEVESMLQPRYMPTLEKALPTSAKQRTLDY
jgi:hypothetical protein